MPVITISRQLGSLGREVAQCVAGMLGYRVVYRELINQAAQRAGTPEVALAIIDELHLLDMCPSAESCQAYVDAMKEVMNELAAVGNVVIIGRAGQVVLGERPDVLHVRLVAPLKLRTERVASRYNISLKAAHEQVKASDRYRQKYLKRFYNVDWDDAGLYDLVLNTAHFTPEASADLICKAVHSYLFIPPYSQPS
jgi:cytidylate kinase